MSVLMLLLATLDVAADFKKCDAEQPGKLSCYLQLAARYQSQGDRQALEQVALRGLKRFPQEKRFYLTAGMGAGRDKRFAVAVDVLEAAHRQWPEDQQVRGGLASAHLGLGMEMLDGGKNDAAEKHLRRATLLAPDDIEARLNLGRALHNLNRFVEALTEFNRVLELDKKMPLARFHRGMALYSMGEFERSITDFSAEIESNADYPPAFLLRGLALLAKGEPAAALADLETAAARMPDNPRALHARARCLLQLGKTAEAEVGFRATMKVDPTDPAPVNSLARLLLQSNRADEARVLLAKAADLSRKQRTAAPGEIRFK